MSDTIGAIADKLFTTNEKMWFNQDLLYEIRRMTFDEFKTKYWKTEDGAERLWETLKRACDLNFQRNQLIDEFDTKLVEMITAAVNGQDLEQFIQRKHKNY
jgi:hypothetical protein